LAQVAKGRAHADLPKSRAALGARLTCSSSVDMGIVETLGNKITERWSSDLAPAAAFWFVGLGAWIRSNGVSVHDSLAWFTADSTRGWLVLVVSFVVVTVSAAVVRRLGLPTLRLLEGYWPSVANKPNSWLNSRRVTKLNKKTERAHTLLELENPSEAEKEELVHLETELALWPADPSDVMPTRLGNILKAGETRPRAKYGLDAVVCWPSFWLVLPPSAREELVGARELLDSDARLVVWSVLGLVWMIFSPWILPLASLLAWVCYLGTASSATVYKELLESSFDVYRWNLYDALHWPLPKNPKSELTQGPEITEFPWRGSDSEDPTFTE
jgi:hypothetical protein